MNAGIPMMNLPINLSMSPEEVLAQGFATHLVAWARQSCADVTVLRLVREAGWRLSKAASAGEVSLPLSRLAEALDLAQSELHPALLRSGVVGEGRVAEGPADPATLHPLILDHANRLWLRRYFMHAHGLVQGLHARAAAPIEVAVTPALQAQLEALFAHNAPRLGGRADWQKLAATLALRNRLTILSGGPGTGKTTTVVAMLACLLTQDPGLRIRLAAPTGKAAARMLEALQARASSLPEALRSLLPGESHTLHRLLGATETPGRFRHHAGNPLALDVLVVDEASMLDLAMAARLFDALPASARLILLGDKDQLAAVEPGAIFAELSAKPALHPDTAAWLAELSGQPVSAMAAGIPIMAAGEAPVPLQDCVIWLRESHRFARDSGIGRLAAAVNAGDAEAALNALRGPDSTAQGGLPLNWLADEGPGLSEATRSALQAGYAAYFKVLANDADDVAAVFAAFDAFRVLCAVRAGARGVEGINALLTRQLKPATAIGEWFVGRPVMITQNDPATRLFNGDIGIALPGPDGALQVCFLEVQGGYRCLPIFRLPAHETAFALTVHKSQGSEFAEVMLVLPTLSALAGTSTVSPVSRELLYTGITRAAKRLTLVGSEAAVKQACQSSVGAQGHIDLCR